MRPGSDFTLLFEQAAMSLVKEMPVLAVSRQLEMSDKRLWRIVHHYVGRMLGELDLSGGDGRRGRNRFPARPSLRHDIPLHAAQAGTGDLRGPWLWQGRHQGFQCFFGGP